MELTPEILTLLFLIAIFAGWVDAVAGGGGLITVPVLVLVGLSPASAIATNKLQGSVGTLTASVYFLRKGVVNLGELKGAMVATFVGAILGGWLVLRIDAGYLVVLLPVLLMGVGLYFLFSPDVGDGARRRRFSMPVFALAVASVLGFYDGFFGPGTGSLMALGFMLCLGYGLPRATANAKVLNCVSNVSALGYFALFGDIHWVAGGLMMGGQYIGAMLGARAVLNRGTAVIRPVVVAVCFLMSLNILFGAV